MQLEPGQHSDELAHWIFVPLHCESGQQMRHMSIPFATHVLLGQHASDSHASCADAHISKGRQVPFSHTPDWQTSPRRQFAPAGRRFMHNGKNLRTIRSLDRIWQYPLYGFA
jgi:hypothetical protein